MERGKSAVGGKGCLTNSSETCQVFKFGECITLRGFRTLGGIARKVDPFLLDVSILKIYKVDKIEYK